MSRAGPASGQPLFSRLGRWISIALVWLVLLEATAWIALLVRPEWNRPLVSWKEADCLEGDAWTEAYFEEWWRSYRVRWHPYVYWRREPFEGAYIHVDADGLRKTWQDESTLPQQPVVMAFGGSTLWGFGARDDFTIPSLISRRLAANGHPCRVVNYGETGYVSTQETIALGRALQQGLRPDAVVFYDGANDVFSAFQSGQAGIPQNEHRRAKEFNLLQTRGEKTPVLIASAIYHMLQQTGIARLADALTERWVKSRSLGSALPDDSRADLGERIADAYLANVRSVLSLAREYGFQAFFYWQPVMFDRLQRTPYEQAQADEAAALGPLFRVVAEKLNERRLAGDPAGRAVLDLTHAFADAEGPLFLDFCHISEKANRIIADRIAHDLERDLLRKGPTSPEN